MKRAVFTISILLCLSLMIAGKDLPVIKKFKTQTEKKCNGYTIIEADKGINCNGDTIKLTKTHGYYEIAILK